MWRNKSRFHGSRGQDHRVGQQRNQTSGGRNRNYRDRDADLYARGANLEKELDVNRPLDDEVPFHYDDHSLDRYASERESRDYYRKEVDDSKQEDLRHDDYRDRYSRDPEADIRKEYRAELSGDTYSRRDSGRFDDSGDRRRDRFEDTLGPVNIDIDIGRDRYIEHGIDPIVEDRVRDWPRFEESLPLTREEIFRLEERERLDSLSRSDRGYGQRQLESVEHVRDSFTEGRGDALYPERHSDNLHDRMPRDVQLKSANDSRSSGGRNLRSVAGNRGRGLHRGSGASRGTFKTPRLSAKHSSPKGKTVPINKHEQARRKSAGEKESYRKSTSSGHLSSSGSKPHGDSLHQSGQIKKGTANRSHSLERNQISCDKSVSRTELSKSRDVKLTDKSKQDKTTESRHDPRSHSRDRKSHSKHDESRNRRNLSTGHKKARTSSGLKGDHDYHEEDVLSILADDDGFEKETKKIIGSDSSACPAPSKLDSSKAVSVKAATVEKTKTDSTVVKQVDKAPSSKRPAEHPKSPRGQLDTKAVTNIENKHSARSSRDQMHNNSFSQRGRFRSANTFSVASKLKTRPFQSVIRNRFSNRGHTGRFSERSQSHVMKPRQTYFDHNQDRVNTGSNLSTSHVWNRRQMPSAETYADFRSKDTLPLRERSGAILRDDRDESRNDKNNTRDPKNVFGKGSNAVYHKRADNYHGQTSFFRNKPFNSWRNNGNMYKPRPVVSHYERVKKKYFRGGMRGHQGMRGNQRYANRDQAKGHRDTEHNSHNFQKHVDDNTRERLEYHDDERIVMSRDEGAADEAPQQQVYFIPDNDIAGMQPQFVDQFGNVVANPEVSMLNPGEVPIQYIPQVLGSEGQGEQQQIFFIPFNQMHGYPENLVPAPVSGEAESELEKPKSQQPKVSSDKKDSNKRPVKKGLSKEARAKIKAKLALKRRKRMEKEIEQKVLNKLLKNSRFSNLTASSSMSAQKKQVIKRISPPSASKPTHLNKKLTVTRQSRQKADDLEDVSDEDKYDNVSDLEDVSDENYYDHDDGTGQQGNRRPVFRKPGQPRIGSQSHRKSSAQEPGDVRRVVDQNSGQKGSKRTVLIEEKRPVKRQTQYDYEQSRPTEEKRHRSMSPIEITVSNENYVSSSRRRNESPNRNRHENNNMSPANQKHDVDVDNQYSGYERDGSERYNRLKNESFAHDDKQGNKYAARSDSRQDRDRRSTKDSDRRDSGKYHRDEEANAKKDQYNSKEVSSDYERNRKDQHRRSHEPQMDQGDRRSDRTGHRSSSPRRRSRSARHRSREYQRHRSGSPGRYDGTRRNRGERTSNNRSAQDDNALNFNQNAVSQNQFMPNHNYQSFPIQGQGNMLQAPVDHSLPPHANSMSGPMHPPFSQSVGHNMDMSVPPLLSTPNSGMNQGAFSNQMQMGQGMQTGQPIVPRMQHQNNYSNQQYANQYQMQQHSQFSPMNQNQMGTQQISIQSNNSFPLQNQGMQSFQQNHPQMMTRGAVNQTGRQLQMTQESMPGQNMGSNVGQERSNMQPMLPSSIGQSNFIAATPQQAVRGVIGTLATGGVGRPQAVRMINKGPRPAFMVQTGGKPDLQTQHKTTGFGSSVAGTSNPYRADHADEDVGEMPCSLCEKVFTNRHAMKKHTVWHDKQATKDEKFKCDSCEQGFPNFQEYSSHIQEKHTLDALNCNACDKTFYTVVQYQRHIDLMHLQSMPLHSCSLCPASFAQIRYLVQHKREQHQRK